MTIINEELTQMKERAEKATGGPWCYDGCDVLGRDDSMVYAIYHGDVRINENDAEFIVHAREDVPRLIAEVERLTSVIWRMSSYCDLSAEETRIFINGGDDD